MEFTARQTVILAILVLFLGKFLTKRVSVLKESVSLLAGEIFDGSVLSKKALLSFLETEIKHSGK